MFLLRFVHVLVPKRARSGRSAARGCSTRLRTREIRLHQLSLVEAMAGVSNPTVGGSESLSTDGGTLRNGPVLRPLKDGEGLF